MQPTGMTNNAQVLVKNLLSKLTRRSPTRQLPQSAIQLYSAMFGAQLRRRFPFSVYFRGSSGLGGCPFRLSRAPQIRHMAASGITAHWCGRLSAPHNSNVMPHKTSHWTSILLRRMVPGCSPSSKLSCFRSSGHFTGCRRTRRICRIYRRVSKFRRRSAPIGWHSKGSLAACRHW